MSVLSKWIGTATAIDGRPFVNLTALTVEKARGLPTVSHDKKGSVR